MDWMHRLSPREKDGLKDLLETLKNEDLFSILDTVTKRMFQTTVRRAAIGRIVYCTAKPADLLRRQKITKKILFNYLLRRGAFVMPHWGKSMLIEKCLDFWKYNDCNRDAINDEIMRKEIEDYMGNDEASDASNDVDADEIWDNLDFDLQPKFNIESYVDTKALKNLDAFIPTIDVESYVDTKTLDNLNAFIPKIKVENDVDTDKTLDNLNDFIPKIKVENDVDTDKTLKSDFVEVKKEKEAYEESIEVETQKKSWDETEVTLQMKIELVEVKDEEEAYEESIEVETQKKSWDETEVTLLMGVEFSKWFFKILNTLDGFGPEHFWPNCNLSAKLHTPCDQKEVSVAGAGDVATFLANLISIDKYYFHANDSKESVKLEIEEHGLVKIIVHGVLHQHSDCVGLFDSAFGLVKHPDSENTYKIQIIKLKMHVNNSPQGILPANNHLSICQTA